MRKIFIPVAAALLLYTAACKTNEANYRSAYEAAKEKQLTGDSLTDKGLLDQQRPKPMVFGSDTLLCRTEYIGYTRDGGADLDKSKVKKFCVTVGKFKQVFNARSMRERLLSHGYPRAMVLHNNMKEYYVVANTTGNAHEASLMVDSVKADTALTLRAPYILLPGHLNRR